MLKLVSLPPSLSRKQNIFFHLPSLVSLPPRQGRKSQVEHVIFVEELGNVKSKFYLKLESLNETMQQQNFTTQTFFIW
jgi:hypothetical protein